MSDEANLAFEAQLAAAFVEVTRQDGVLKAVSGDFGRVARGQPLGLIRVRDESELHTVFELANALRVRLTLRCGGNSQSGQSIAHRSYCVSLIDFETSVHVDPENSTALCSASIPWRAVVEAAGRHGLVPKVVPLNLDLSVGGTLSAGGFGASSHRYGSAASNVLSLTAITGAGERVTCSRASRPEVFDAVLAGLGRTAALTSATISLRRAGRHVQTVFALYSSLQDCLQDMQLLSTQAACSYLEGSCSSCFQGLRKTSVGRQPLLRWFYGIQFSVEYDAESGANLQSILDRLRCFEVVHRESDDHQPFLDRYRARFAGMHRSGAWEQAHPWFEGILAADAASAFIEELLVMLPGVMGDGHRLFLADGASNPRYLQLPADASNTSLVVAILPTGIPESSLATALEFVRGATELLHRHGGKRYLSGWLEPRDGSFWRHHHGSLHEEWEAAKRALDPHEILTSELFSA
jgi:cytokinin dehydrogenase